MLETTKEYVFSPYPNHHSFSVAVISRCPDLSIPSSFLSGFYILLTLLSWI